MKNSDNFTSKVCILSVFCAAMGLIALPLFAQSPAIGFAGSKTVLYASNSNSSKPPFHKHAAQQQTVKIQHTSKKPVNHVSRKPPLKRYLHISEKPNKNVVQVEVGSRVALNNTERKLKRSKPPFKRN